MIKKRESKEQLVDFLARGGEVTIIPPIVQEEASHMLQAKTTINYDVLSLGDGEFYFGETRTRKSKKAPAKRVNSEDFTKLVDSSGLPSHIVEALKLSAKGK